MSSPPSGGRFGTPGSAAPPDSRRPDTVGVAEPAIAAAQREIPVPMTIGRLSRRTGVPVKTLRAYEEMGFIYTVGRSEGNYRLFGEEALWCVGLVTGLRELGVTLAGIKDLTAEYLRPGADPIGPRLAAILGRVRRRTEQQVTELGLRLERIRRFEAEGAALLSGRADLRGEDPRLRRGP